MASIDKSPVYLFENLPGEEKYRFAVLKMLETLEAVVMTATNKRDSTALIAIQSEVADILRSASTSIEAGVPYIRDIT